MDYHLVEVVETVLSLAGAVFAALAWLKSRIALSEIRAEKARLDEKVSIVLRCGDRILRLPYRPVRRSLTRAEVAGVLGLYSAGRRFDVPGLSEIYRDGTFDLACAHADTLVISVPEAEFEAFSRVVLAEGER